VGPDSFDVDYVAEGYKAIPGQAIDWANKMMKPVTNYWTTYRRLWQGVLAGETRRAAFQPMARWVADNPPFPAKAYRDWITAMYKENQLVRGRMRLRRRRVDLERVQQSLLVVTAGADHIAPPQGTKPLLDLVSSEDVTCIDRPGGHIGLMAGSKARNEIWPDIAQWLAQRSNTQKEG
jgi:polyhydroxyalkanoate synthase